MTTAIYDDTLSMDQIVYLVEGDSITETRIRDISGYIDETTTPHGVGPRVHVRGAELWSWGASGNRAEKLADFASEAEAIAAMERCHAHDFWASSDFLAFASRAEAEAALND